MSLTIDKSKLVIKPKNTKKPQSTTKNNVNFAKKPIKFDENKPKNDKKQQHKKQNRQNSNVDSTYTYRPFASLLKDKK